MSTTNGHLTKADDLVRRSYEIVKRNWKLFAFVNIFALISGFFAIFDSKDTNNSEFNWSGISDNLTNPEISAIIGFGALAFIITAVVTIAFYILSLSLQLRSAQQTKPLLATLIADLKKYGFRLVGLHIALAFIVLIGLILLIIPGIIALFLLCLAPYIMIDQDAGIVDSIKRSYYLVKANIEPVVIVIALSILLSIAFGIVGVIPFVGVLISTILSIFITPLFAIRYVELRKSSKASVK